MRFTLSTSALSSKLMALQKVINAKNSIPVLDCFLFQVKDKTMTITASDNENVMISTVALDESDGDGEFCMANRKITDAVKELPEQPLTFDIDLASYSVKILYQNGMYRLTAQTAEEYPRFKDVAENATVITVDAAVLTDNINRSLFARRKTSCAP